MENFMLLYEVDLRGNIQAERRKPFNGKKKQLH